MVKSKKRNSYSEDFKLNAVKMSNKPGVLVSDVAAELGVNANYLSKWRAEYQDHQSNAKVEARIDAIAENHKLKDEVKRLKMELEILKKAAVYFASQK